MVWSSGSARFTLDDSKLQAGGLRIGTSDHSGILDSAVSEMHSSEPGLHLELALLLRPVSARTFRQQPYISSADPESMLAPTPMTYQTDRTLTPVAWERGGIRELESRIKRDSSSRQAERALRLAVRERGLAGTTVAPPGRARARVGSREKMGRSGRTRRGPAVALFPVTLPPPEPRHTALDQPPLRSGSGQASEFA